MVLAGRYRSTTAMERNALWALLGRTETVKPQVQRLSRNTHCASRFRLRSIRRIYVKQVFYVCHQMAPSLGARGRRKSKGFSVWAFNAYGLVIATNAPTRLRKGPESTPLLSFALAASRP